MNNQAFLEAIDNIVKEKNIEREVVWEAMELAMATAYKKNFDNKSNVKVKINRESGDIKIYAYQLVVKRVTDPEIEITVAKARKIKPDAVEGDELLEEVTPQDFGRVAAGTAKQVVMQKIREAERESIMIEFNDKEGELVVGSLSREDVKNYYVDLGRAHGILPKSEMIPGELVKMGTSIKVYISKIENGPKGPVILLTRKHYNFVKRLFEREIPELMDGTVMIHSIAREAGERSKVAVYSNVLNVDAIGACIGNKGARIANIIKELAGEKVDLVLYDKEPKVFIENALSPAKNLQIVFTDESEENALVIADPDNLSLAIGKRGINVKLAARLVKKRLDVMTLVDARDKGYDLGFVE